MHLQRAAGIEPIPAKPQEESADHAEWNVVWQELVFIAFIPATLARAHDDGRAQGGDATDHVDKAATRKVHVCRVAKG
eukprot:4889842-Amphidinium_carterae.2